MFCDGATSTPINNKLSLHCVEKILKVNHTNESNLEHNWKTHKQQKQQQQKMQLAKTSTKTMTSNNTLYPRHFLIFKFRRY